MQHRVVTAIFSLVSMQVYTNENAGFEVPEMS